MSTYRSALAAYLDRPNCTETVLADAIGKTQPTVNRYRNGERFPDADTARLIDQHTGGEVSFVLWQAEFLSRSGLAA
jgi:transcriptional regulator with XRE-family HTH domain